MKRSSAKDGRGGRARTTKQPLRRKPASEVRSVDRRLKAAVDPNFSGPVLGRANIVYELAERSRGVRGHEKIPTCGQVDVPARGQVKVPTPL